jgi:hypothetical protein
MLSFDTHVLLVMHSQLAGRLQALTAVPPFIKTDAEGRPIFTDEQIMSFIPDLPIENSRAGLFIWLNACLCARPLTDDLSMLTCKQSPLLQCRCSPYSVRWPRISKIVAEIIAIFETSANFVYG